VVRVPSAVTAAGDVALDRIEVMGQEND
jgi:hypothetical protein